MIRFATFTLRHIAYAFVVVGIAAASGMQVLPCAFAGDFEAGDRDAGVASGAVLFNAEDIRWETRPSGVRVAVLYGSPDQPGPFVLRLEYPPGYEKAPHYHPGDALVTVFDGAYARGYGASIDPSAAFSLTPGTFSVNPRGVSHYEWTDDGAGLQVFAMGPWKTVYVDKNDLPIAATDERPTAAGGPMVIPPSKLQWVRTGERKRSAALYGDAETPELFAVRSQLEAGYREEPHTHPVDVFVTVISGTMRVGFGTEYDARRMQELTVGAFFVIPAGTPHFEANDELVEIEVHARGPWSTAPVVAASRSH